MADDKLCAERHKNCTGRMESQANDIDRLFDSRIPWRVFYWTLGVIITVGFFLVVGSYGYTKTVADDVAELVTKGDMKEYQKKLIDEIKEIIE